MLIPAGTKPEDKDLNFVDIIKIINPGKLNCEWIAAPDTNIAFKAMVIDYLGQFKLHLGKLKN
ncbi:MAG: hypothetical protein JXB19_03225 [Bacteroidales bacterium]|nr:hypothetical protein [Bacteroidales bacterium]